MRTKKFGSNVRTWAYASVMMRRQCYIGHCSPAVCAVVVFVLLQCRLEIDGDRSGLDDLVSR
jgi:hypothetical protein